MSVVAVPNGIVCTCPCHRDSPIVPFRGVSILNAVETVTACHGCINDHCQVLLERRVWWDEPEIPPWVDSDNRGEGAEA